MIENKGKGVSPKSGTKQCSACGTLALLSLASCTHCGAPFPALPKVIDVGMVLDGKYEIIDRLGAGGMGDVFKAYHTHLGAFRTVKVMKRSLLTEEEFRSRFLREARIATRVNHPHVALIYDFCTLDDGSYCMISEFIDGITIKQWISRHGSLPFALTIQIALQVLSGLEHCHRRGLLHRDISADNIMIARDADGQPLAKIIDLGIAKVVTSKAPVNEATGQGMFVGNPKYSSPEQLGSLDEGEEIDARADLYCFGVVLFEMVTGVLPFISPSPFGFLVKHLMEPPPTFAQVAPGIRVPGAFEELIRKALEKDRRNRFDSARDFSKALQQFESDLSDKLSALIQERLDELSSPSTTEEVPKVSSGEPGHKITLELAPDPTLDATAAQEAETARHNSSWQDAVRADSREAFESYLASYPSGASAGEARGKIEELAIIEEIPSWIRLRDTPALLKAAERFDTGTHARDAIEVALSTLRAREAAERQAQEREFEERRARERSAFDDAMAKGTSGALTQFLSLFPDSELSTEARSHQRERFAFEAALKQQSEDAWEEYLAAYGGSPQSGRAREYLKERRAASDASFAAAGTDGTSAAWRAFLSGRISPEMRQRGEAALLEAAAFEEVDPGDIEQLRRFLAAYPDGRHGRDALDMLEMLEDLAAVKTAEQIGSAAAWRQYLSSRPQGSGRNRANTRLNEIEREWYRRAIDTEDASVAEWFFAEFPDSALADELRGVSARWEQTRLRRRALEEVERGDLEVARAVARQLSADDDRELVESAIRDAEETLAWKGALDSPTTENYQRFIASFPDSPRADLARSSLREIEDTAYRELLKEEDPALAEHFVGRFPASIRAPKVRRLMESWTEDRLLKQVVDAIREGDEEPARLFLEGVEDPLRRDRLEKKLDGAREEAAWDAVESNGSLDSVRNYLLFWPQGSWSGEARQKLNELEDLGYRDLLRGENPDLAEEFLTQFPESARAAKVRQIAERWRGQQAAHEALEALKKGNERPAVALLPSIADPEQRKRLEGAIDESRDQRDWQKALKLDSESGYGKYITDRPKGAWTAAAEGRLAELRSLAEVTRCERSGDREALETIAKAQVEGSRVARAAADALQRLGKTARRQHDNQESEEWRKAFTLGTEEGWQTFIQTFPDSRKVAEARRMMSECRAFYGAIRTNTLEAWRAYLRAWPDGRHGPEANVRLQRLEGRGTRSS